LPLSTEVLLCSNVNLEPGPWYSQGQRMEQLEPSRSSTRNPHFLLSWKSPNRRGRNGLDVAPQAQKPIAPGRSFLNICISPRIQISSNPASSPPPSLTPFQISITPDAMAAPKQDASADPGQGSRRTKEDARGPQASPSRDAASDLAQAYQDLARYHFSPPSEPRLSLCFVHLHPFPGRASYIRRSPCHNPPPRDDCLSGHRPTPPSRADKHPPSFLLSSLSHLLPSTSIKRGAGRGTEQ
jgi:hypothetical protein